MSITVIDQLQKAKDTTRLLAKVKNEKSQKILLDLSTALIEHQDKVLAANKLDLSRLDPNNPRYDRLKLTPERIADIALEVRNIAHSESPLNRILESRTLDNGLQLERTTAPIGVVGVVYESRPNVTCDIFALSFKSGNCCVLKGGRDAADSNTVIVGLIQDILRQHQCPEECIQLLPPTREAVQEMLTALGLVDLIIPRGSRALIDFVRENSKVPIIETGAGVVHTYVDQTIDREKAKQIIFNAKARRVSVCNALDTLLVHQDQVPILPELLLPLADKCVEIFADKPGHAVLRGVYPAHLLQKALPEHYGTEFLDYKLSLRCVDSLDGALNHIAEYSSQHSEAIISEDPVSIERFLQEVDAAVVYANASTAFTDGAQMGLGAEIGISTQKLPPRGPISLRDITTYKWKVRGSGQIRR